MEFEAQSKNFDFARRETVYLRRRVRDEADAAASAHSLAATLFAAGLLTTVPGLRNIGSGKATTKNLRQFDLR